MRKYATPAPQLLFSIVLLYMQILVSINFILTLIPIQNDTKYSFYNLVSRKSSRTFVCSEKKKLNIIYERRKNIHQVTRLLSGCLPYKPSF